MLNVRLYAEPGKREKLMVVCFPGLLLMSATLEVIAPRAWYVASVVELSWRPHACVDGISSRQHWGLVNDIGRGNK
jgi:hypothetical protein